MVRGTGVGFSQEENELLTRVGSGTLMGDFFRQYWMPVLLPTELTLERPQKRIRLLGENLVAFRTESGAVGLVGEFCSHRLASLYFGRVEGEALRCLYHGWLYGTDGQCLEQGNLRPEHQFTDHIHHPGYQCVEYGGIVWAYMGPEKEPPGLPELEWALVPDDQRHVGKYFQDSNYLQAMEGGIDPSHVMWLHSPIELADVETAQQQSSQQALANTTGLRIPSAVDLEDTPYGFVYGAKREMEDGKSLWRVNQWLMPFHTMPPGGEARLARMWVPIDDERCVKWVLSWYPERETMLAATEHRVAFDGDAIGWEPETSEPYGDIHLRGNRSNDYLMDWHVHYTKRMGVPGVNLQDICVTENEGPGPILDRSKENLCGADLTIVRARRRLLEAARALADGTTPAGVRDPEIYRVRAVSAIVADEEYWLDGVREQLTVPEGPLGA